MNAQCESSDLYWFVHLFTEGMDVEMGRKQSQIWP